MVGWSTVMERIRQILVGMREVVMGCCSSHVTPVEDVEMGDGDQQGQQLVPQAQALQVIV